MRTLDFNRHTAIATVPFSSVFYCSQPFAAALTRKRVLFYWFLLSLTHVPEVVEFTKIFSPVTLFSQHFRFSVLEWSNKSKANASELFASKHTVKIGLLCHDQEISYRMSTESFDGQTYLFSTVHPVEWNGWYFQVLGEQIEPTKFSFHVFEGERWRQVGSSTLMQVGKITVFMNGYHHPDSFLAQKGKIHFRLKRKKVFGFVIARVFAFFFTIAIPLLGAAGQFRYAVKMPCALSFCFIFCQLLEYNTSIKFPGDYSSNMSLIMAALEIVAVVLAAHEQWVAQCIWYGVSLSSIGLLLAPYGDEGRSCTRFFCGIGLPMALFGIAVKVSQRLVCRAACRAIREDRAAYDALWRFLLAQPGAEAALSEIDSMITAFHATRSPPRRRQSILGGLSFHSDNDMDRPCPPRPTPPRPRQPIMETLEPSSSQAESKAVGRRVRQEERSLQADLARLYAAAAAASPHFRLAVLRIAAKSGGLLPAIDSVVSAGPAAGDGFLVDGKYVRVTESTVLEDVAWAALKNPQRAIEKVLRSYGDDATLLCDLCRQCIVYENLDALSAGLSALLSEPSITPLRVKNRLSPHHDPADTAGYRDVCVNLTLVGPVFGGGGPAAGHVCELQLVLLETARRRSQNGHRRYIAYRNAMGS